MPTEKQLANLRPIKKGQLTKEESKARQRNGGKKSAEKRRQLKEIREWAEQNLFTGRGNNNTPLFELLFKKLEQLASQGNLKAVEMIFNYSGLKPVDLVAEVNTKGEDIQKNDLSKINTDTLLKMAEKAKIEIEIE